MKKAIFNWSGGKDSALALYHTLNQKEFEVQGLLTSINTGFQRVSMHGVRLELLQKQIENIGLPLHCLELPEALSMKEYDQKMHEQMKLLKKEGIEYSIFGDIFLEDLRKYREEKLNLLSMKWVFPLWQRPTSELVREFIDLGFQAVIVCVNAKYLDSSFAGRLLDEDFIKDLPPGVDVCGENGEYHSFVFDAPYFKEKIPYQVGEKVFRNYARLSDKEEDNCGSNTDQPFDTGFWFCDIY